MNWSYAITICFILLNMLTTGCTNEEPPETTGDSIADAPQSEVITASPNVQKVTFRSESLGKEMRFNIYFPEEYTEGTKYPVLYMIHGYGGNENQWMPELGIDQTADALLREGKIRPLIIVSPQINNSYGFNSDLGRYSDYIINDLIPYVDHHFSTAATKENRYIGGLSMGGWATLHHAFRHPELFSKAGGHSPALWVDDWTSAENMKGWLYPSEEIRVQRDPLLLAASQDLTGLSVYLDSGDEDEYKFYKGAEALYQVLQSKNVNSEYHHAPGRHNADYWRGNVDDYLLFYAGK